MVVDSRTIELTQGFYDWELRGRGWATFPETVVLEPAFRKFRGHGPVRPQAIDDARRHTWFSSLVEELRGAKSADPEPVEEPEEEPQPEADPRLESDWEIREHVIALPQDTRVPREAVLAWLSSLSTASGPVSFEMLGWGGRVELRLATLASDTAHVLRQLQAALPPATVTTAEETLGDLWMMVPGERFAAIEFGLAREFMLPLVTVSEADEPLLSLLAALADTDASELGLVQVLFEETRHPWSESILRSVMTPAGKPFFADAPEITKLAQDKVSTPLYAVGLRVAGVSSESEGAWDIVRRIAGGLSRFGSPVANELMPLAPEDVTLLEQDLIERTTHRSGMLLSAEELASLLHLPGARVQIPELWRARRKTKRAPEEVTGAGCFLGLNDHEGELSEARLPVEAKTKHVHVVGASGTGKSTLLARMILEDIEAGHGVGVLDPHGDLVSEVAGRIPEDRLDDVVWFDPADEEQVVGWNILGAQSEVEKDLLASDLVGVFRRLSTTWGDQMTAVLANAILIFLESPRGGTLEELRRFLLDEEFRAEMLTTVPDAHVVSFWEAEFPLIVGRRPQAPILTRLDTFLRSKLVRRVVTVKEPKLDFRKVTDEGHIFLGNLSMGVIGEENAALLGSLVVSKFHQVTLARVAQELRERRPFFLYVDEFHHVATASMAALFSGVRKYRLGLTVAHHDLHQLHRSVPEVERSLLANAYTRICFRVGDEDARQLGKGFSYFDAEDLMELRLGEALCRVGGRNADFNIRTETLPLISSQEAKRTREVLREQSARRWAVPIGEETEEPTAAETETLEGPAATAEREAPVTKEATETFHVDVEAEIDEKPRAQPQLDKATLDYLEHLAEEPFLSLVDRHAYLGLSVWKGNEIKKRLLESDLVREVVVHPGGRGQRFKLLELTRAGREVLSTYGIPAPKGHGRGGIAHQWWANRIAEWLNDGGVPAEIEDESQGARVDISFFSGAKGIAVEIEMTAGHAAENIRKDLDAGFDVVVSLVDASASTDSLEEEFVDLRNAVPPKVLIGLLQEYEEILKPHLRPHPPPLRRPRQKEDGKGQPTRKRRKTPASRESGPDLDLLTKPGALLTPDAGLYVGLSPSTLETMRSRGGGPTFSKLGQRVVYRREDLDAWLAERQKKHTNQD